MHVTARFHGSFVTIGEANATTIDGIFAGLDCDDGPGDVWGFDGRLRLTKQQKLRVPSRKSRANRDVTRWHVYRSRLHARTGTRCVCRHGTSDEAVDPNFNISDGSTIDACGIGSQQDTSPPLGAL